MGNKLLDRPKANENEVGSARMCERQISLRQSSERQSRRRPEKKRSEEGTSNVSEPIINGVVTNVGYNILESMVFRYVRVLRELKIG